MLSTMIFCFIYLIFQDLLSYSDRQRATKTELPPIEVGWGYLQCRFEYYEVGIRSATLLLVQREGNELRAYLIMFVFATRNVEPANQQSTTSG